jgi:hypothetical protein
MACDVRRLTACASYATCGLQEGHIALKGGASTVYSTYEHLFNNCMPLAPCHRRRHVAVIQLLPTTCFDRPVPVPADPLPKRVQVAYIDDDDGGTFLRHSTITTILPSTSSQWCTARSATSPSKRQTSTDTWTPSASPSLTNPLRRQHRPNQRPRASSLHQLRNDPPASRTHILDHRHSSMALAALSKPSLRGLLRRFLSRPSL